MPVAAMGLHFGPLGQNETIPTITINAGLLRARPAPLMALRDCGQGDIRSPWLRNPVAMSPQGEHIATFPWGKWQYAGATQPSFWAKGPETHMLLQTPSALFRSHKMASYFGPAGSQNTAILDPLGLVPLAAGQGDAYMALKGPYMLIRA